MPRINRGSFAPSFRRDAGSSSDMIDFMPNVRGLPCRAPRGVWKTDPSPALAVVSCSAVLLS